MPQFAYKAMQHDGVLTEGFLDASNRQEAMRQVEGRGLRPIKLAESGTGAAPKKASALLVMLQAEPLIEERVEAATLVGGRRWDLKLKSGADVKLPEDELGLALRKLATNHEEDGILDKNVLSIDVREGDRITVRTKPGAVQEFNAGATPTSASTGSPI